MVMSHALGDAISPAIVGRIAVAFTDLHSLETQYLGLQRALFLTAFVCALGGFLFLMVTLYLVKAKNDVHRAIQEINHPPIDNTNTRNSVNHNAGLFVLRILYCNENIILYKASNNK
ncbi:unnamed protein product [Schistosoma mattheei]|uniref:Uncharacterized protein n=1 Tax=Schistosoma mattheei TaxID=31246 RepID=A0A183NJF8_9TREM|nr:unnamed protein product [Schistosoma mattheei]